jgi:hypothetical protein
MASAAMGGDSTTDLEAVTVVDRSGDLDFDDDWKLVCDMSFLLL